MKTSDSADNLFGKTIAAKLKIFPEQIKCLVKHEITNLIYKHKKIEVATSQTHSGNSSDTYKISQFMLHHQQIVTPTFFVLLFFSFF